MPNCLTLKKSNCKNCYKCIRHCPVKAIRFSGNQAHIIGNECILCGQCFVVCPQNAKEIVDETEKAKVLLQSGDPVIVSLAPSFIANYEGVGINAMRKALKQLGFYDVEETAIGATIVKTEYERMLKEDERDVIITSCCHSVNLLIQKYFPKELEYLAEYTPMSFDYEGWQVSDEYVYNPVYKTHSQYRIIVTSKDINDDESLGESVHKGEEVVRRITELIPFCTLLSLNEPSGIDITRTLKIKITNVPPRAWEFNYQDVKDYLDDQKPDKLRGIITCQGFNHYSEFSKSPLIDLELMLKNYKDASEEIRYLVFLYNAIIESEDSNRYMLIGKALEIINVLYPYRRKRDREDCRFGIYRQKSIDK